MPRDPARRYALVRLHNTEGRSNKFYEVWVEFNDQSTGRSWTACRRWGPIPAHGQTLRRAYISRDFAYTEVRDLVTEKQGRGYRVVMDNTGDRDPSFGETRNLQGVERVQQRAARLTARAEREEREQIQARTEARVQAGARRAAMLGAHADEERRRRLGLEQEAERAQLSPETSPRKFRRRMVE